MKAFFNTINAQAQLLFEFEHEAKGQEFVVLEAFNKMKCPMAWFEVKAVIGFDMDDCSLKRALSTLTTDRTDKEGNVTRKRMLVILENDLVTGPKGKPCHRYKLL